MSRFDAYVSISQQCCQPGFLRFFCSKCTVEATRQPGIFREFLHYMQKMTQLQAGISVDISMKKIAALPKLADMKKKDARLTIRIPRELKAKIEGIDRVYGVALPKIANECLKAFCEYVEQKKQTPTFPLSIGPYLPAPKTPEHGSLRRRRGFRDGRPHRI